MAYTKQELNKVHPTYNDNQHRWKFLQDSYLGGADYARGEYLTRYTYESKEDYFGRVSQTPLDNHVKSIVSIYNSFIFAKPPKRDFMNQADDPLLQDFLADADYDGRSWDSFMREVDVQASIFGHAWIVIDKPEVQLTTRADEISLGVRPYVSLFSPLAVTDWHYERATTGQYQLMHLKVNLVSTMEYDEYMMYWPDRTDVVRSSRTESMTQLISTTPNPLGYIPAVCVYATRSHIKGVGISDIGDIADTQRAIYDELSEIEQLIRISNHPSLVSTQEVQAAAGAGARIIIPENQDSGLKPYLLQPTAQSLDGIRNSIKDKIDAINQMANVSSVRTTQGRSLSGVAMQTEFTLLNSHLTSKSDGLELAEEQVFDIIFAWMGQPEAEFEIDYPETFNTRDRMTDLVLLEKAKTVYALPSSGNPVLDSEINKAIVAIVIDDEEGQKEILDYIESQETQAGIEEAVATNQGEHPSLANSSQADRLAHIQEMLMTGYANDEIMALHPEVTLQDIIDAGAAAAAQN